jgi:two-component system chemotaxis sensor kinase CheA
MRDEVAVEKQPAPCLDMNGLQELSRHLDAESASPGNAGAGTRGGDTGADSGPSPCAATPAEGAAVNPLAQDPELIRDFVVESREHLGNIEGKVLEIERGSAPDDAIHSLFRSFHTIKGLAGFLDFTEIQEVAHSVETLLDLARNGSLALTPVRVDCVLAAADFVGNWLRHIERGRKGRAGGRPQGSAALLDRIRAAIESDTAVKAKPAPEPREAAVEPAQQSSSKSESAVVKVDTARLEYLVDMVGELVIAQSLVRHNGELGTVQSPRLQRDLAQLSRVTAEVQKTAMAMRMVPIGHLFRRMTRLVRDLSRKSGKPAELVLSGEDVELDRRIVEELADPLVHMVRNSMDHGLEPAEERETLGKPRTGVVRIAARHQAGQIAIEISDDGRGMRRERILEKAIERGMVQPGQGLTDAEVFQLIFRPGFSTASAVTDISGRGVGMDVVRRHVEKLRGRIEVDSVPGKGTSFLLKLPLTLAIIEGLVVTVGRERFIVPLYAVREIVQPSAERMFTVEGRGEVVLVRDRLLPLVRLHGKLGVEDPQPGSTEGLLIVGEYEGRPFCLRVDGLSGKQEVVIKSLGPMFEEVGGIAGSAILGDGRVGLILDLAGLAGEADAAGVRF